MKTILLKFKGYIILIVIILAFAGVSYYQNKAIERKNAKIDRLTLNIDGLLQENASQVALVLTEKEVTGKVKAERDSLAKLVKRPIKTVVEWRDKIIHHVDTVPKYVPVYKMKDSTYLISDKDVCFTYEAMAIIENDNLQVQRLLFDYHNTVTDIIYWRRRFPVIGKKIYTQETRSICGGVVSKEVSIIKR